MKNLDDNLRDALRREEPPEGFAERVLRRVEEQERNSGSRPGLMRPGFTGGSKGPALRGVSTARERDVRRSLVRWAAAAAVFAAVAGGGIQYRTAQIERARAERAAGEAAGRQVVLALQIAGSKLQLVQTKIARMHQQPDNQ